MTITLDKDIAEELISDKLIVIDNEINKILSKWNFNNIDDLIDSAKNGSLEEDSIDDAMDLQNLRDKRNELVAILSKQE